jgi:hypothetical protein
LERTVPGFIDREPVWTDDVKPPDVCVQRIEGDRVERVVVRHPQGTGSTERPGALESGLGRGCRGQHHNQGKEQAGGD